MLQIWNIWKTGHVCNSSWWTQELLTKLTNIFNHSNPSPKALIVVEQNYESVTFHNFELADFYTIWGILYSSSRLPCSVCWQSRRWEPLICGGHTKSGIPHLVRTNSGIPRSVHTNSGIRIYWFCPSLCKRSYLAPGGVLLLYYLTNEYLYN